MSLIDFILNLAGLLLWVNWRAVPLDPLTTATPATLIGTLRRAEPSRVKRWHFLVGLGALLVLRAFFYRLLGPAVDWTATLNLFATQLAFRSDSQNRMLLYSGLSFGAALGFFLLGLLFVSVIARGSGETSLPLRLARAHLGFLNDIAPWKKLLLPFMAGFVVWWSSSWPLAAWGLIPRVVTEPARLGQAALVGVSAYLTWKYLIVALLALYLVQNYVYLGRQPIWNFVEIAGRRLLRPLQRLPLRAGKVDLAPLVGIILILLFTHAAEHGVRTSQRRDLSGRLEKPKIPGLAALFERVSR